MMSILTGENRDRETLRWWFMAMPQAIRRVEQREIYNYGHSKLELTSAH